MTLMASLLLAVAALVFKRPILNVVFGRIEADVMEKCVDVFDVFGAVLSVFGALQCLRRAVPLNG